MTNLHFVVTADGSKTIFNPAVGENYHSKHGALQESKHVFVKSGLHFFLENNNQTEVSVLEVGFGTGLNFLLSAEYCLENKVSLHYTGIEAFPLSSEMIGSTEYGNYVSEPLYSSFIQKYQQSLKAEVMINDYCKLQIVNCKLEEFIGTKQFDVLYFDAFAAIHQPEMWTTEALEHCCDYLKPGGVFVTYAITGNLKRSMKSLGFDIEKAPGAPGKREMLRAIKK
jgi:tRNA U34 5-methylaminomethyl-2-thiouridine-forming methyltransferase MnmC